MKYTDLKNSKQKTISVKRSEPRPDDPLAIKGGKSSLYFVKGTVCSIIIYAQKRKNSLWLGFPSFDEMSTVYQELSGQTWNAIPGEDVKPLKDPSVTNKTLPLSSSPKFGNAPGFSQGFWVLL